MIKAIPICSDAIETAVGANERPITIIVGPITTGGKTLLIHFVPVNLIMMAKTK